MSDSLTSITVTTGVNVEGRVLARNGAVTLDTDVITSYLPVRRWFSQVRMGGLHISRNPPTATTVCKNRKQSKTEKSVSRHKSRRPLLACRLLLA